MTSSMRRLPRRRLLRAPFGDRRAAGSSIPGLNRLGMPAAVLALSVTVAGCAGTVTGGGAAADRPVAAGAHGTAQAAPGTAQAAPGRTSADSEASGASAPALLPGLGTRTRSEIPANARQVLLVTGQGKNSSDSRVVLYRRTGAGWEPGATWPAHNALRGWTDDHHAGDLRSPIGVFSLTDAGGLLADPGTRLPYNHSGASPSAAGASRANRSRAPSTTSSRSTTTASPAPHPSTGPALSARTRAAAYGCTSTTAGPRTAA